MELYRITQELYADDLSGNGSRIYGGRWNSEGYYALYTAATRSLALLETLAHIPAKLLREKKYLLAAISIPDHVSMEVIEAKNLPSDRDTTDILYITQKIGDRFLQHQKIPVLQVPSVLIPEEYNYVINPLHPVIKQVKVIYRREIQFHDRLIKNF